MAPRKPNHQIFGFVLQNDGHVRITKTDRTVVAGGAKESHEQAVEFVHEVDKEMVKDPPQTDGELRMIVRDAAKKTGLKQTPRKSPKS